MVASLKGLSLITGNRAIRDWFCFATLPQREVARFPVFYLPVAFYGDICPGIASKCAVSLQVSTARGLHIRSLIAEERVHLIDLALGALERRTNCLYCLFAALSTFRTAVCGSEW